MEKGREGMRVSFNAILLLVLLGAFMKFIVFAPPEEEAPKYPVMEDRPIRYEGDYPVIISDDPEDLIRSIEVVGGLLVIKSAYPYDLVWVGYDEDQYLHECIIQFGHDDSEALRRSAEIILKRRESGTPQEE